MSNLTITKPHNAAHTNNNPITTSHHTHSNKTSDLINRIHALPLELFDAIQDLVFTAAPDLTTNITKTYKPPVQLQISQSTRKSFAAAYYATMKFTRLGELYDKFLDSLSEEHRGMIPLTCYVIETPGRGKSALVNRLLELSREGEGAGGEGEESRGDWRAKGA
ncbi:hypothetical protein PRZ48_014149 [Zasmidium cellare]|uniref:Uncharacterized protein n=1 Tax=Zasmidium cellare TaxID=395010 RepID=A0ABR0E046_ZASCE|nr:hypothetical protein PRZ48_014149 [Zasmidium cellare]